MLGLRFRLGCWRFQGFRGRVPAMIFPSKGEGSEGHIPLLYWHYVGKACCARVGGGGRRYGRQESIQGLQGCDQYQKFFERTPARDPVRVASYIIQAMYTPTTHPQKILRESS